jgi:pimeloyl-ACP methyl ester carboxylesterase
VTKVLKRIGKWGGIGLGVLVVLLAGTYFVVDWTRPSLDEPARAELLRDGRAKQFVKTSQGVMHVRVSGPADGPVVLLVHGGAVGGQGFQNWQKPLADAGYRVIVPDLLGYGYSQRPDVPYTREFYTRQLSELLSGLNVTKPVNVIGASLGGTIATTFAAQNPAKVISLALMAPAGGGRSKIVASPLDWPVVGDWIFRVLGPAQVEGMITDSYANTPARDEMTAWMKEQGRYSGFGEGILNTIRNYDSTWQPDTNQAVGRTNIPVLAVWGTADKVNPYSQSAQLAQWIPQLQVFTLDGQGHAITYGQADTVLAKVIPFLAEAGKPKS